MLVTNGEKIFCPRHWKQTTTPWEELLYIKKGPFGPFASVYSTTTTCFYDKFKLSKPIVWKRWHQQPLVTRLLFVVENRNKQTVQLELRISVSLLRVWRESQRKHDWRKSTWRLGKQGCTVHEQNSCTYIKCNNMLHRPCWTYIS